MNSDPWNWILIFTKRHSILLYTHVGKETREPEEIFTFTNTIERKLSAVIGVYISVQRIKFEMNGSSWETYMLSMHSIKGN